MSPDSPPEEQDRQVTRLFEQGMYADAIETATLALSRTRLEMGPEHPDVARRLNRLGLLYTMVGDHESAEQCLERSLAIRRRFPGRQQLGLAAVLNNLAGLRHATGDLPSAVSLLEEATEIRRRSLRKKSPLVAMSLNNLGLLYWEMGQYQKAEAVLREALKALRRRFGRKNPREGQVLNNLGALLREMGDPDGAEQLLRRAVDTHRQTLGEAHLELARSLSNLAKVCASVGHPAEAFDLLQRVARIHDQAIANVFSLSSERQRLSFLQQIQADLDVLLSLTLRQAEADPHAIGLTLDVVLRRKAIAAEALAAQRDALLGGRYPTLGPQVRQLTQLRRQIAQKTLAGPDPERLDEHRSLLARWAAAKEALEGELAKAIPEMRLERRLREADRWAVARALPEGSALVEFLRFDEFDFQAIASRGERHWIGPRYIAFVLIARVPDTVAMVDLGEGQRIDDLIAAYRSAITLEDEHRGVRDEAGQIRSTAPSPDVGVALRQIVFDPLASHLGGARRVFLSPDGDLSRLPFGVLPTDDGGRLIEAFLFAYVTTGRDAIRFGAVADAEPAPPLVAADPDFDLAGNGSLGIPAYPGRRSRDLDGSALSFPRLAGTRTEGEVVATRLGVDPWLDGSVLEAAIKAIRSPIVLHLATHGFFLPDQTRDPNLDLRGVGGESEIGPFLGPGFENPLLRSGLALAGANGFLEKRPLPEEAEDGILTAEDVSGLDLVGTELVVLSACETGLGDVRRGEGVFGLRRAFVLAGAETLVMSLWKVPDEQTRELMDEFYTRLMAGAGRAEALLDAQVKMANRYDPWYWGAFICQGDPGPLGYSLLISRRSRVQA